MSRIIKEEKQIEKRVLFVCSGNKGISPIVVAQGESLCKIGIEVSYFGVEGKGLLGYMSNLFQLKKTHRIEHPDIIHAHYSYCGILSYLATRKPVITSLMGSDVKSSGLWRMVIRIFTRYLWSATIVKSEDMKTSLGVISDKIHVVPNGVDMDVFKPLSKVECRVKLGWDISKRIVLFAANPSRHEKNFELAKQSFLQADLRDAELKIVFNVKHEDIPYYLCASDLLISTSKWEGSPNVIKEAMACNCKIVSTPVGDVPYLLEGVNGSWIVDAEPSKVAEGIREAVDFGGVCNGRERIASEQLDSASIARKIIELYRIQAG